MITYTKVATGSYIADTADLHIKIDRLNGGLRDTLWFVFISHKLTADILGPRDIGIYQRHAFTFREAKVLAEAFATKDSAITVPAFTNTPFGFESDEVNA